MMKNQRGFTLIELAIVLVIIGLLLGGVLKGQELIYSAKIKNVIADFANTTVGFYGYQDRYKAIPGDDSNAAARWGAGFTSGGGNNSIAGEFSANVAAPAAAQESSLFWQHMRKAGFIGGSGSGNPTNAFGGLLGVQNGGDALQSAGGAGTGFTGVIICQSNIPDKAAIAIDNQLDDGIPNTGIVRAIEQDDATTPEAVSGVAAEAAPYVETGTTYYTMCKSL